MARRKKASAKRKGMNVFISYSSRDKELVEVIANRLEMDGHRVSLDSILMKPGDNVSRKIHDGLEQADVVLFVVSLNSLRSEWGQREFVAISLQQLSEQRQRVIPIRLDHCEVPSYLIDRLYIDFADDFQNGLKKLSDALKLETAGAAVSAYARPPLSETREAQIDRLSECLKNGMLTLFCGAGVSIEAKIPSWNELLTKLLGTMMERLSKDHSLELGQRAAEEFLKRNSASSLILGKYLKNTLGRDFLDELRAALYEHKPKSCAVIDSIVQLSRPQRSGRPLESIVTFNFDCLIEDNLENASIPNKAICSELIDHDKNELPIYHVHGFLPRTGEIHEEVDLVFSEDAYHSQFIDPFSWSNLIQLNKLTQSTCLFVGISLTDPNMRRLLDVAWRKNPQKRLTHYIIKKLPKSARGSDVLDEVSRLLEEQDANGLGLNVVWIESYDEIPAILTSISTN